MVPTSHPRHCTDQSFLLRSVKSCFSFRLIHMLIRIPSCHIYGRHKLRIEVKWAGVANGSGALLSIREVTNSVPKLVGSVDSPGIDNTFVTI